MKHRIPAQKGKNYLLKDYTRQPTTLQKKYTHPTNNLTKITRAN